jgi:His-Xaa-Ser system protein HxsD
MNDRAVSDEDSNPKLNMHGISQVPDGYSLSLSTSIYSVEAVKKAAYKFAGRTSIIINPGPDATISLVFNFAGMNANNDPKQVIADFCNELLDQDLRERIKKETEPLRNLILAHAFSRTSLAEKNQP